MGYESFIKKYKNKGELRMKKLLFLMMVFVVGFVLVVCGLSFYEIVMIIDIGDIDDELFN